MPIALVRNDLKPYTGDAFFALGLLALTRWVDRDRRPRSVVWLGAGALAVYPFSTTSAFVSAACFCGWLVSALLARDRSRAVATVIVAVAASAGFGAVSAVTVLPHINIALRNYWRASYLTGGPFQALHESWHRLQGLEHALAMPGLVVILLFALGAVALARMRETAIVLAVPFLWIEMFVLGRLRRYPFLDQRTFHFVLIPTVAVIAIGVASGVVEISRRRPLAGALTAAVLALAFGLGVVPSWHELGIEHEDARADAVCGEAQRVSDVVLVSSHANWGLAYYWPHGHVLTRRSEKFANGFVAEVADINAVYASDRTRATVLLALHKALDRQHHAGSRSRIFIVRSHVESAERDAWSHAFAVLHLRPRSIHLGPEPLLVIDPAKSTVAISNQNAQTMLHRGIDGTRPATAVGRREES